MAVVYLAARLDGPADAPPVAIKILRPEIPAVVGPDRFLREAALTRRLAHPNLVPVIDSGEVDGIYYLVMPYVPGETLRTLLREEGQLPLGRALEITRDLVSGLAYAHRQGVVHRDVKPENVLFDGPRALLADFGIARVLDSVSQQSLSSSGLAVGTPAYMSPEQAAGGPKIDQRADTYALGLVVYEMLAGEPAFSGPTPQVVAARQISEQPRSLAVVRPDLPPAVARAVATALAKSPADRYQRVERFGSALEEAATAPTARPDRSVRLRWWIAAAAVVLAAVAVTLLRTPPADAPRSLRLAVLYFADLTPDRHLVPIATGLTDFLIDELTGVPGIAVVSAGGVGEFRDRPVEPAALRRKLGVERLVTGSLQDERGRVVLAVRLLDAASGTVLASATLEREPSGVFDLQRDLAGAVSRLLRESLGQEIQLRAARRGTRSPEAWVLTQRALGLRDDADQLQLSAGAGAALDLLTRADSMLQAAERIDPGSWLVRLQRAWTANGRATVLFQADRGRSGPPAEAVRDSVIRAGLGLAESVVRREPSLAEALDARGALLFSLWRTTHPANPDSIIALAESSFRGALDRDSLRAGAWYRLSLVYQVTDRPEEEQYAADKALAADGFLREAPQILSRLMIGALRRSDPEAALDYCRKGERRFAGDLRFAGCALTVWGWSSRDPADIGRAWSLLDSLERPGTLSLDPAVTVPRRYLIAAIAARTGLADSAEALITAARRLAAGSDPPAFGLMEAWVRTELGQPARALELIARVLDRSPQSVGSVRGSPWFAPLRTDSTFRRLAGLTGRG